MSLRFKFERGLKEGLCLVGALTAPTQALWIFAQLGQWAAEHFHDLQVVLPEDAILALQTRLRNEARDLLPVPSSLQGGDVHVCCKQLTKACPLPPTLGRQVKSLRLKANLKPGFSVSVWQDTPRLLPVDAYLHPQDPIVAHTLRRFKVNVRHVPPRLRRKSLRPCSQPKVPLRMANSRLHFWRLALRFRLQLSSASHL